MLDLDSLTIGDVETMEAHGVSLTDLGKLGTLDTSAGELPSAKVLAVVAWLTGRADNPALTIQDCKQLTFSQLMDRINTAATPSRAERD